MNKSWFYLGTVGSLAIALASCGDANKPTPPATSPSPAAASPAVSPRPIAAVSATPVGASVTLAATIPPVITNTPTSTGKKSGSVDVAAGSIASTDGDNWARTIARGRSDPFAALALQPIEVAKKILLDPMGKPIKAGSIAIKSVSIESGLHKSRSTIRVALNPMTGNGKITKGAIPAGIIPDGNSSISSLPRTGINRALPKIAVAIKPIQSGSANSSILRPRLGSTKIAKARNHNVLRPVSGNAPNSKTSGMTDIAARSEQVAAKPLQAMAIEVSGIIEVGGKTQVIVKLPNESSSRYIDLGDRLANGTVLVKRVDERESLSPTVILEEVGVEVSRKIGEKPVVNPEPNPILPATLNK
ncbi:hypothetical protein [Chamaesiphon sp.]|uniref:hypothetical protein n=1 Tax=Chamaesiphon sp. TaxID=2814140 RepID=UPI0035934C7D